MQPPPNNDSWAIRFARFINHVGTLRSSILFVFAALSFTILGSYVLRIYFNGEVNAIDFVTAIILTLLSAPWVLFFFSHLVKQLESSRESLEDVVAQLEHLREEDVLLNRELQNKIHQLNHEMTQREEAKIELEELYSDLELEIKDRYEKEQQAQRISSLLRSIIDSSPDLIYYRNQQGQFAGCNRIAEEMTGKTESQLVGLTPQEVYSEDIAARVVASDHEVLESDAGITYEIWLPFADGSQHYYEMRKVPFYGKDGDRLGLLAFGRDMTKRKEAEDALEKVSRDKTAFIATISHELRTPLNGIVGLSRMLRDTKLDTEQCSWVNTIYTSAITLGNIFNDIVDLDKLGRDRLELAPESIELKALFEQLHSVVELLAHDKGLVFDASCGANLPDYIEADATRLRQILWNILYNAVKFTKSGKVCFSLNQVKNESGNKVLRFIVSDSGIGIPKDELNKIFAMYYQVKDQSHSSAQGTGIGLAISLKMANLMGGSIEVDSEVGSGSQFTIDIPLTIASGPKVVSELKVTGARILLVEDIELNVMVARALLEKMGVIVSVAMTGNEALDMAKREQFDLILLDIQLPDISGFEVASKLHELELVDQTPIVALTANVIKTRQEYLDNGMDDVIAKPIKMSQMIEVLNSFLAADEVNAPLEIESKVIAEEEKDDGALDYDMLNMLTESIGAQMLLTSVEVFQKTIDEYLNVLQTNLAAKEQDLISKEAHKIKGAASSVGLSHVRKFALLIEQKDHPAWWENVYDWFEELKQACAADLPKLVDWLKKKVEEEQ
ncbi:aerobic respiration two-component sensor histidine kinase ArcB [Alteromonadaceae bacterium BrNp21-10]|nr:aerobic respiration two-component sensor histidine kinase ArcB [Alteromonadaceae bacterium BrNp21-10]